MKNTPPDDRREKSQGELNSQSSQEEAQDIQHSVKTRRLWLRVPMLIMGLFLLVPSYTAAQSYLKSQDVSDFLSFMLAALVAGLLLMYAIRGNLRSKSRETPLADRGKRKGTAGSPTQIAALRNDYEKIIDEHESTIVLLNESIRTLKGRLTPEQQNVDMIQKQVNVIENRKSVLEAEIADLESKKQGLSSIGSEVEKSEKAILANAGKLVQLKSQFKAMQAAHKKIIAYPESVPDPALIVEAEELLSATVELRLHYMDSRQLKALFNQNKKAIDDTLKRYADRYTTKVFTALYKLMVLALEAELQNVLFGLRFGKLETAIANIREITAKYQKIAAEGNQTIAATIAKFIAEIEYLYTEAIKIEYEYYAKKEAAKEEQRALREQMRQEAEERKRLEQELARMEKEEEKFRTEIDAIIAQMDEVLNETESQALSACLDELKCQLQDINNKKDDIVKLQHGKAGYVYIISNVGSFGENVFKIGMTRRSEPLDRVNELGDASVPFPFDVHSFIFSDDAVGLENDIHKALHAKRVNKVNRRKEFFNVSIEELEEMVYSFQPTAEFRGTMVAEQYSQSLSFANDDMPSEDNVFLDTEEEDAYIYEE